jgi:hypothetical protein
MRSKLKLGEGSFEEYIPEIGSRHAFRKKEMASTKDEDSSNPNPFGTEEAFFSTFMEMKAMVEEMYEDRKKAKGTGGKGKGKPHKFTSRSSRREKKKRSLHVLIARRKDMRRQHVGSCIQRGYQRSSRTRVNKRPQP